MARDYWFAFGGGTTTVNSGLNPTFITFMNDQGTGFAAPTITEIASKGLYLCSYGATTTIVFTLDGATTGLVATDRYINGVFDPYDMFGATLNSVYGLGNTGIALGTLNLAIGSSGIALGNSNVSLGNTNVALGTLNLAIGNSNIALGNTNIALGNQSITLETAIGVTLIGQGNTIATFSGSITGLGLSLSAIGLAIGTTASSYGSTGVDPVDLYGYLKRNLEFNEGNKTYTKASGLLDYFIRGGGTLLREKAVADSSVNTTTT
jgi:hypothetical protein